MSQQSSHINPGQNAQQDARKYFADLAPLVVQDPASTRIVNTTTKTGRRRYLVVDRARTPSVGDWVVVASKYRHKLIRYVPVISPNLIWGTVIWTLQEA